MTGTSERLRLEWMAAEYVERIGGRIRQRREELELSRDDLARKMPGKTTGNQIYRWEKGRHEPQPDTLEALAHALKVDVAYFFAGPSSGGATPDLMATVNGNQPDDLQQIQAQLDRIEQTVNRLREFIEAPELASAVDAVVAAIRHERPEADEPGAASTG